MAWCPGSRETGLLKSFGHRVRDMSERRLIPFARTCAPSGRHAVEAVMDNIAVKPDRSIIGISRAMIFNFRQWRIRIENIWLLVVAERHAGEGYVSKIKFTLLMH